MKKKLATELTWLGHSFFKVTSPLGKVALVDPWIHFPPGNLQYPKNYSLGKIDFILITHGHLDHIGDTVELAKKNKNLKIICNFEIALYLMEQKIPQEQLMAMNKGGQIEAADFTITMVHAQHSSGIGPFSAKTLKYGGEAAGFIIHAKNSTSIYHAGDTNVFSDMKLIKDLYKPDIALLPMGGVFTMGPLEAAYAVKLIKPKIVIPMHFGGAFGLPGKVSDFKKLIKNNKVICPDSGKTLKI